MAPSGPSASDLGIHDSPDADKNVLRHYSFEKGLLSSFVSLDSISKSPDAHSQVSTPGTSYLHCGKDRVSVYLGQVPSTLKWMLPRKGSPAGMSICLLLLVPKRVDLPLPMKERFS